MVLLAIVALCLNAVLIWAGTQTLFLQTHWDQPMYVLLALGVVGAPIVNSVLIVWIACRMWKKQSRVEHSAGASKSGDF